MLISYEELMIVKVGGRMPQMAIIPYAESVTPGHPDLACNTASDYVLDEAIKASARVSGRPRVALEVTGKGGIETGSENLDLFTKKYKKLIKKQGLVVVVGEVTLPQGVKDFSIKTKIVEGFKLVGYNDPNYGFYPTEETVLVAVNRQSEDIEAGVGTGGAGDQGAMIGFATKETPQLMPMAMMIARDLTSRQFEMYKDGVFDKAIRPDGKSQVSLRKKIVNGKLKTVGIDNITIAVSHDPKVQLKQLKDMLLKEHIAPVLDRYGINIDDQTQVVINGAGPWTIFGPVADAGTQNRKLMVQSFGLASKHGGGGYSGKDPTKVDRSGALFARHIAVSLVNAGIVDTCEVFISFSIGHPIPHVLEVNTYGTNALSWTDRKIARLVKDNFSWTVAEIIDKLELFNPWYVDANLKGVFGNPEFPWEQPSELK